MGSFSDVYIQCNKKAFALIEEVYKKYKWLPTKTYGCTDGSTLIKWRFIKWDNEYEEVKAVYAVLDKLDESEYDKENAYKFVRVGSEFGDVEERSNDEGDGEFCDLYPVTEVNLPDDIFETEDGVPVLDNKITATLERRDMSVSLYASDGAYYAEISFYSPAGEDFNMTVHFDGTDEDFVDKFEEEAEYFDPDEHAEMWVENRSSVRGVPQSVRDLIDDAEAIDKILAETAEELRKVMQFYA